MWLVLMLVGVALLGFCAGLFSFKVKTHWCTSCGLTLRCPKCTGTKAVANILDGRGWR